jgi:hypothetical protein
MASNRIPSAVCSPQRQPLSFRVKSLSKPRVLYNVSYVSRRWSCDCPDARYRGRRCKHMQILCLLAKQHGIGGLAKLAN